MKKKHALKHLKKLKKEIKTISKRLKKSGGSARSLKQLKEFKSTTKKTIQRLKKQNISHIIGHFKSITGKVLTTLGHDITSTLLPLLNWLNLDSPPMLRNGIQACDLVGSHPATDVNQSLNKLAISVKTPYKTNPCKRCPALRDDNCTCAVKKYRLAL